MKKIIALFLLVLCQFYTYAQEIQQKNIPAIVLNAFQLKFPNATDTRWKLETGNYHVRFKLNNKVNELVISDKGTILKHQRDLYVSEIPPAILETIKLKVPFFDVSDADRIEESGKTVYVISSEINGKTHDFTIDEKGKLLRYVKELRSSELPVTVSTMIKNKYGAIETDKVIYTEENGRIVYTVEGEINDMDHYFIFDEKGTVLKHKQKLRKSEIPIQVLNAILTAYNGFEIRDADLTEESGKAIYNLDLSKSKTRVSVTIDSEGKILEFKNR